MSTAIRINWDEQIDENWSYKGDDGRTLERRHRLERRAISSLRTHEKPSSQRIAKMVVLMLSGAPIPLPKIGDDGMVLDGHCRLAATKRILGKDAVAPLQVNQIVELKPAVEHPLLQRVDNHLQEACNRVEAGFYFEEGGCFGMAIALHDAFTKAGIEAGFAIQESFVHGMAIVDGDCYDYCGKIPSPPADLKIVTRDEFAAFAKLHGHGENDLIVAQSFAETAIQVAVEIGQEAAPASGGPKI